MSDSSDSDVGFIPDRATCQKLTEQFAAITATDEACAQFYLQDREWDLERSVNAFFEDTNKSVQKNEPKVKDEKVKDEPKAVPKFSKTMLESYGFGQPSSAPPSKISVVSWNLDGLDDHNLSRRTQEVCKILYQERADVVFLQELIPTTFSEISDNSPEYMGIPGNTEEYFTAVFLRKSTVSCDTHKIIPFPGTRMGRNIIHVKARIGKMKFHLFNTHLESGAEFGDERKAQLKKAFEEIDKVAEDETVIFGGDLNIRDKEIEAVGGIPPGLDDLWVACGSRPICRYTWDTVRNSNKSLPGKFKPRMRFDRLYVRYSHPREIVAKHFGLVGIQKVPLTQSFPSDHWGIQVFFELERTKKDE